MISVTLESPSIFKPRTNRFQSPQKIRIPMSQKHKQNTPKSEKVYSSLQIYFSLWFGLVPHYLPCPVAQVGLELTISCLRFSSQFSLSAMEAILHLVVLSRHLNNITHLFQNPTNTPGSFCSLSYTNSYLGFQEWQRFLDFLPARTVISWK